MEIINGIGLLVILFVIVIMDIWSTKVGFIYNHKMINNKKVRDKILEKKRKDEYETELNPIVRLLMKKFGMMNGMIIHTLFYNVPMFAFLTYFVIFEYVDLEYIMFVPAFYVGAIFMQVWKSYSVRKDLKIIGEW